MTSTDSVAPGDSRLSRMLERLMTQRACLEYAAAEIAGLQGPVLEVGLGKGRTYDHLRRLLPDRDILVFDREVHATRDCIPPESNLFLGDFLDTLPRLLPQYAGRVALAHTDLGSENLARDLALVERVGPLLEQLLQPGALLIGDRPFRIAGWQRLPLPSAAGRFSYHLYRAVGG